jgi:hypothetical protein
MRAKKQKGEQRRQRQNHGTLDEDFPSSQSECRPDPGQRTATWKISRAAAAMQKIIDPKKERDRKEQEAADERVRRQFCRVTGGETVFFVCHANGMGGSKQRTNRRLGISASR